MPDIELREVADADLPILFEHQRDPEAIAMAVFPGREREAFMSHWARIRADPAVVARTIVADGTVAGWIGSYRAGDERLVSYWIGREWWGKGIATRALGLLLPTLPPGPVHAHVAVTNVGSRRVLEKCGFVVVGAETGGDGVGEHVMRREG